METTELAEVGLQEDVFLTYNTFELDNPEEEPPLQKLKMTKAPKQQQEEAFVVQFSFLFHHEQQRRRLVRCSNGEEVVMEEEHLSTLTRTFTVDTTQFSNHLQQLVADMLTQMGVDKNLQNIPVESKTPIEYISSSALAIVNSKSNLGHQRLSMCVELSTDWVGVFDENELVREGVWVEPRAEAESRCHMVPASEAVIKQLQKIKFDSSSMPATECAICIEDFEVGSEVTLLPCPHMFHADCIARWLGKSHKCPVCRFEMPV